MRTGSGYDYVRQCYMAGPRGEFGGVDADSPLTKWFGEKQEADDYRDSLNVHAPECPAARDDDAPEHELSCTCGGRDE